MFESIRTSVRVMAICKSTQNIIIPIHKTRRATCQFYSPEGQQGQAGYRYINRVWWLRFSPSEHLPYQHIPGVRRNLIIMNQQCNGYSMQNRKKRMQSADSMIGHLLQRWENTPDVISLPHLMQNLWVRYIGYTFGSSVNYSQLKLKTFEAVR